MTSDARVSVDSAVQEDARGQSATTLTRLAEGLPTLSGAGIKAEHFSAARSLLDRARSALKAASATNATTADAAEALGSKDRANADDFTRVLSV